MDERQKLSFFVCFLLVLHAALAAKFMQNNLMLQAAYRHIANAGQQAEHRQNKRKLPREWMSLQSVRLSGTTDTHSHTVLFFLINDSQN